jgi:TPP-dependent 2-oxoacid decarboxylase
MALSRMKPVYLEIACNIATAPVSRPIDVASIPPTLQFCSDEKVLDQALHAIKDIVDSIDHVVLVAGSKMTTTASVQGFLQLANKLQCAIAIMPDAKGIISEDLEAFVGTYWGEISSDCAQDFVETADLVIFVGPMLNDYTTVGWTSKLYASNTVLIAKDHVSFQGKRFSYVYIDEVLKKLCEILPEKSVSLSKFKEMKKSTKQGRTSDDIRGSNLSIAFLKEQLQDNISNFTNIIVDTGDSWFIGESLAIPNNIKFHIQMQYGAIGWALPALLGIGVAQAEKNVERKNLVIVGDGAFQVSVQELSSLFRYEINSVILVINNKGYVIEQKIHPGDYNNISNWNYASFGEAFGFKNGGVKVSTCEELQNVLLEIRKKRGTFVVECCIGNDDCSPELTIWGSKIAEANRRD